MRILAGEIRKVFLENTRANLDFKALLKLQKAIRRNITQLRKFSAIISSNIFSVPFLLSYPSENSKIQMIVNYCCCRSLLLVMLLFFFLLLLTCDDYHYSIF